jgi:hypothetical protein
MSFIDILKSELRDSFDTLLGKNGPPLVDDETSMALNKTIKARMTGLIKNTRVNNSRELMDAISAAIDADEEKDSTEMREAPFKLTKRFSSKKLLTAKKKNKLTKRFSSKKLLTAKKKNLPSVDSLVNSPLAAQDVVKGEESINYYELANKKLGSVTAKDINRSLGSLMIDKETISLKSKKSKKEKNSAKKSIASLNRMGSIQSIVNSALNDDMADPPVKPNLYSLGITAKDLYKSFDDGLENALTGKDEVKAQGGSIADVINAPLNEEYGSIEEITVPIKEISLKTNVAALIRGEDDYYVASKEELEKEKEESTTLNFSIDEQFEPLLYPVSLS